MLKHLLALMGILLALPCGSARAATDRVQPTTSAAEAVFGEWLAAFNSGDRGAIKAFYGGRLDDPDAVFALDNAEDTCGFDVVRTESRTALATIVLLAERCFAGLQRLTIELNSAEDSKPKAFKLESFALSDEGAVAALFGIADRLAARDKFAGSLIVSQGDDTLLSRSWGPIDKTAPEPITADTPMFIASAGKMFAAVAVLQLVDAGKIELDAPLGRYLTDYPNAEMAKVTIRQLLNHRAGTGDIAILGRDDGANRARVRTIDDIIALNGSRPPAFAPGSKEDYSNYGFVLLGAVVESVSGQSYYDYVADHIFAPAA